MSFCAWAMKERENKTEMIAPSLDKNLIEPFLKSRQSFLDSTSLYQLPLALASGLGKLKIIGFSRIKAL